jgi:hypothetical protein
MIYNIMKNFVFVTGVMKGVYVSVTDTGDSYDYSGVSLYLGVGHGESVSVAWDKLASKHSFKRSLPDIPDSKIFAFEITGEGIDVVPRLVNDEVDGPLQLKMADEKYKSIPCRWCGEQAPNNGGAQFSHLKSHLNELVSKKFLDVEQVKNIRSVKLPPDLMKIFEEAYKKKSIGG